MRDRGAADSGSGAGGTGWGVVDEGLDAAHIGAADGVVEPLFEFCNLVWRGIYGIFS